MGRIGRWGVGESVAAACSMCSLDYYATLGGAAVDNVTVIDHFVR